MTDGYLCTLVGTVAVAQSAMVQAEAGYLDCDAGAHIKVLCSMAADGEGWIYGQLMATGECGWLPYTALSSRTHRDGGLAPGIVARALEELAAPAPRGIGGYLSMARNEQVRVEYVGSYEAGDAGWLFGRALGDGGGRGWFPAASVRAVGEAVELSIMSLGGRLCTIAADRSWTLLEVKSAIENETRIPWDEQKLLNGEQELHDGDALPVSADGNTAVLCVIRVTEEMEWINRVAENCKSLREAPALIRANREVVIGAVREDGYLLQFAAAELKADREIVLIAVRQNGNSLSCVAPELHADHEIVLAAVGHDGLALDCASEELKSDYWIVMAAVQQNWRALEYAQGGLRESQAIVQTALAQSRDAIRYARGAARRL